MPHFDFYSEEHTTIREDLIRMIQRFCDAHNINRATWEAADLTQTLAWDRKFFDWVNSGVYAETVQTIHPREFAEFFCDEVTNHVR